MLPHDRRLTTRFFPRRLNFKSTHTMPPVKKPPVKKSIAKKPKGGKMRWVIGPSPTKPELRLNAAAILREKGTTPSLAQPPVKKSIAKKPRSPTLAQLSKKGARKAWVQRMGAYDSD